MNTSPEINDTQRHALIYTRYSTRGDVRAFVVDVFPTARTNVVDIGLVAVCNGIHVFIRCTQWGESNADNFAITCWARETSGGADANMWKAFVSAQMGLEEIELRLIHRPDVLDLLSSVPSSWPHSNLYRLYKYVQCVLAHHSTVYLLFTGICLFAFLPNNSNTITECA